MRVLNRKPDAYMVRRPIKLWGKDYAPGAVIEQEKLASLVRVESLVRAGKLTELFEPLEK